MDSWIRDEIRFETEYDLQGHMFSACLELMRQETLNEKVHVYLNRSKYYVEGKLPKIDLVLGEDYQIIAEFKFNKQPTLKPVLEDLDKLGKIFSTLVVKEDCKTYCGFFGTLFQIRGTNTIETYRESLASLLDLLGMSAEWKEMNSDWVSVLVSVCP